MTKFRMCMCMQTGEAEARVAVGEWVARVVCQVGCA